MPAVFPSWFNSRLVSSLTGRVRKSLTAHWLIMLPTKKHFNVGRADVQRMRSPGQSSRVIDKQPPPVNAPKFVATLFTRAIAGKKMHKWYLRLPWQNEMACRSAGRERRWECGGGGGRRWWIVQLPAGGKGLINGRPLGKTHQLWAAISTNTKRELLSLL